MAVPPPLTGPPDAPSANAPRQIPPQQTPNEDLNLLQAWREPLTPRRLMPSAVGSVLFHVVVLIAVILLPEQGFTPRPATIIHPELRRTILEMPRNFEPTQKDPNQGKVSHELDVRSMRSAPEPQAPRFHPPSPPPGPIAQALQPVQLPAIEAPKLEAPKIDVPSALPALTAVAPKAAPPPPEKPKLAFEDVGAGPARTSGSDRTIPTPKELVPDPLRSKSAASGGGGAIVGDLGDYSLANPNSLHAPSPGDIKSSMQLLSDPKGIDFKPYMIQVLMAVRRNWLAILPESVRNGRRGRVIVQFAIDRTGGIPKLVIAEGAGVGADALDRAAVAAISASVPLPPLPADYKGDQIRLQFAFSYNMPAR